ncbi:MAG: amidase [Alphaproteobacteria bacterium]|nr:amidase [Alphaproteobacteria bacterium]
MPVNLPSADEVREIAARCGFHLSADEIEAYRGLMPTYIASYNFVDGLSEAAFTPKYPRTRGARPDPADNTYGAWAWKVRIEGAAAGPLKGKTVALKDSVMVAGVPMMNGARPLEGFVPEYDATVVTRLLDAGATIIGKAECEALGLSGASHTSPFGPVHNPRRHGFSAGGSSSGCATLIGLGEVDLALGGDQGGSIRMPASYSGIVGLKPTYGLVPYTGIMPMEIAVDHAGPMSATVRDNARMLEAIAGPDGIDSRQRDVVVHPYASMLEGGAKGLRIGVVKEGFGWPTSEPDVDAKVRAAATLFCKLGATVEDVSIPLHRNGIDIWQPVALDGIMNTATWGEGQGASRLDRYSPALMARLRDWPKQGDSLPHTVKMMTVLGTYIRQRHGLHYYAKAMNLWRSLRAAYDAMLAACDLLLMPTLPMKATKLPASDAGPTEIVRRAHEMLLNVAPFDATHHPAISIPCGQNDGLPIGLMLIGRHFDEPTVYRAAHAFEQAQDWRAP